MARPIATVLSPLALAVPGDLDPGFADLCSVSDAGIG